MPRDLLNLLDRTCELSKKGLKTYGGNYNFYREQKRIEDSALEQRIDSEQAALRLARKKAQEIAERQQKRFNQGERNKDQSASPRLRACNRTCAGGG